MFDNEIREIFELCLRVHKETDHYVGFDVRRDLCCVFIREEGSDPEEEYDGFYEIFRFHINPDECERMGKNCEKAKSHLLKLLGEGGQK